jgi:hypothetical protein
MEKINNLESPINRKLFRDKEVLDELVKNLNQLYTESYSLENNLFTTHIYNLIPDMLQDKTQKVK